MNNEVDETIQQMIDLGLASINPDGTFRLSEGARRAIQELIEAHPEKYAEFFPDRLN